MYVNHPLSIAETVLLTAVSELFLGALPAVGREAESLGGDVIVGAIGFGGADMRGEIALSATVATWQSLAPRTMGIDPQGEDMLCDMVGELANMLAGRLRNAFLRRGVEILVATPNTKRCEGDSVPTESTAAWHDFATPAGEFRLYVDLSFAEGFDFTGREAAVVDPNEHELVLF
jgi:CheY-specific phosphatase CheX